MTDHPRDRSDSRRLTRRESLTAVGAGIGGGVLGTVLLPDALESEIASTSATSVDEESTAVPESETPYAVWQYHYDWQTDDLATTSPINLVSPLEDTTFSELTAVLESAGWTDTQLEYTLWAWDDSAAEYRRPDWTGTETVFGLTGRLHLRAWHIDGRASIQTHIDSPATPTHTVSSYARARRTVADLFEAANWTVPDDSLELGNDQQPDHDGEAYVIRR